MSNKTLPEFLEKKNNKLCSRKSFLDFLQQSQIFNHLAMVQAPEVKKEKMVIGPDGKPCKVGTN